MSLAIAVILLCLRWLAEVCSQYTSERGQTRKHHNGCAVVPLGLLESSCGHTTIVGEHSMYLQGRKKRLQAVIINICAVVSMHCFDMPHT